MVHRRLVILFCALKSSRHHCTQYTAGAHPPGLHTTILRIRDRYLHQAARPRALVLPRHHLKTLRYDVDTTLLPPRPSHLQLQVPLNTNETSKRLHGPRRGYSPPSAFVTFGMKHSQPIPLAKALTLPNSFTTLEASVCDHCPCLPNSPHTGHSL